MMGAVVNGVVREGGGGVSLRERGQQEAVPDKELTIPTDRD